MVRSATPICKGHGCEGLVKECTSQLVVDAERIDLAGTLLPSEVCNADSQRICSSYDSSTVGERAQLSDAAEPQGTQHEAVHRTPEARWPMAVAVLATIALQIAAPHTGRVAPWWVLPAFELAALAAIIIRDPGRIDARTRAARRTTMVLIAIIMIGTVGGLALLIINVVDRSYSIGATSLLGRGASLWVTNVLVFSLLYWEIDRGGAADRAVDAPIPPSFGFPEDAMPELVSDGWMPRFPDYLYLSFTNATAFSPTDTLPVRTWAKMAMMAEAVISLITAILVIARAINVLPT